jgi:excisionase family DNA binding protein
MALLDVSGAAEYLGVTDRQVRDLWAKRKLTGVKVGRLVRFDQRDLDRFIEDNRFEAFR